MRHELARIVVSLDAQRKQIDSLIANRGEVSNPAFHASDPARQDDDGT